MEHINRRRVPTVCNAVGNCLQLLGKHQVDKRSSLSWPRPNDTEFPGGEKRGTNLLITLGGATGAMGSVWCSLLWSWGVGSMAK